MRILKNLCAILCFNLFWVQACSSTSLCHKPQQAKQTNPTDYLITYSPTHSSEDQIIIHSAYILKYNEEYEQADWVIYFLTKERVIGSCSRTNDFRSDPMVKTGSASLADYKGSGYDRGHLAPAGDMKWSKEAMSESFYMSNMSPQKPRFNREIWKRLESLVRSWAIDNEEIFVVTGPILSAGLPSIGQNNVAIPEYYYKVVLDYKKPELKGIGFILPNQSSQTRIQNYAVSIDLVERRTGIDFFPVIPDSVEELIESRVELSKWPFIGAKHGIQGKATGNGDAGNKVTKPHSINCNPFSLGNAFSPFD